MIKFKINFCDAAYLALPKNSIDLVVLDPPFWNHLRYSLDKNQLGNIRDYIKFLNRLEGIVSSCVKVLKEDRFLIATPPEFYKISRNIEEMYNYSEDIIRIMKKNKLKLISEGIIDSADEKTRDFLPKDQNILAQRDDLLPVRYRKLLIFAKEPRENIKHNKELVSLYWKPIIKFNSSNTIFGSNKLYKIVTNIMSRPKLRKFFLISKFNKIISVKSKEQDLFSASLNQEVANFIVKSFSKEHEVILDPFIGSGTYVRSCFTLNRSIIGYEVNKKMKNILDKKLKNIQVEYSN